MVLPVGSAIKRGKGIAMSNNSISEYQKAIDHLHQMALDGQLIVGSKIPSERKLAQEIGISRNSTREAISILRGV